MLIVIASKNRVKLSAIERAFRSFNMQATLEILGYDVSSGVPRHPFDSEVYEWANNRLRNLHRCNDDGDYYVSVEGGLIRLHKSYYNVQYVIVEDKDGNRSTGISQGYPIPKRYLEEIRATSIADVFDKLFGKNGGVRALTNNCLTREQLIYDGTVMALTGLMNGEQWEIT